MTKDIIIPGSIQPPKKTAPHPNSKPTDALKGINLRDARSLDADKFPNPPTGKHGLPSTLLNLEYALQQYGVKIQYNVIKKRSEIFLPDGTPTSDNRENVSLTYIISLAATNGMNTGNVPLYVEAIADANPYNPVAEWIQKEPWDGIDRVEDIVDTITAREGFPAELKHVLIYRWLLSCVAAALSKRGFKARGVLTLQGPQGCGKTSWVTALMSDAALRDEVIKIDHHLDGNNKDSILTAISHWIVEIGELDSSFKKDIARLKGFLTSDQDKVRRPYARNDSEYMRRTVFCATVNAHDFLVDLTGNTRWWTIPVQAINHKHCINMQQVFAQLAVDFQNGEQWWLTADEETLLEKHNSEHRTASAIQDRLLAEINLNLREHPDCKAYSASEVLKALDIPNPSNGQCKECGAILRDLFGDPRKINGNMKWRVPFSSDFTKATCIEFIDLHEAEAPPAPAITNVSCTPKAGEATALPHLRPVATF